MKIDFNNERPIYIQLVESIKLEIISGRLNPGDKLPSVREYAITTRVNPNTMQKALSELEEAKLIYTERTNGKFVTSNLNIIEHEKEKYIEEKVNNFLEDLKELGMTEKEMIDYINRRNKWI